MTEDPIELEDSKPAPEGKQVKCSGGKYLLEAKLGNLLPKVDQGHGSFKGAMRESAIKRVTHVPSPIRHDLISTRRLQRDSTHW